MSLLELVKTGKQIGPRRTFIYGVDGVGKSTFAASFPKPIFICTESGLDDIDTASFPISTDFESVINNLTSLVTEDHEYETVCIDSLDWLEPLVFDFVCRENGVTSIGGIPHGKGYMLAGDQWSRVINGLSMLREKKNMNIVLIAHSKIEAFKDPEMEDYDRFSPNINKRPSALLREWADEVFFCNYKTFIKDSDTSQKLKGVGNGDRIIKTQARPSFQAKNRLGMPLEVKLDYDVYKTYLPKQ